MKEDSRYVALHVMEKATGHPRVCIRKVSQEVLTVEELSEMKLSTLRNHPRKAGHTI
jgi:hypothetical protein